MKSTSTIHPLRHNKPNKLGRPHRSQLAGSVLRRRSPEGMEEEAPVTAATGALGPVIVKLRALVRRRRGEYQLRWRTRKDVKFIRSKLKSVHSILWVIWEREDLVDAAGKELRMEAWRLADDMNDAIDDFILSLIKRSNDGGNKRFIQAKNQPSPFQDLKQRAVDVYEQCSKKWKKMEISGNQTSMASISLFSRTKATVDDSGLALAKWRTRVIDPYVHKDISELFGVQYPRDKLIKHLVGEEDSTSQLKMACIVGAAGEGKTTLARLVYEAIQDKFQARAFVSVNSSHNMVGVLASILQQVSADSTDVLLADTKASTKNKYLIDAIWSFLKDKRYMVIVDDIWHYGEWKTIEMSLPDNNLGSRIVTTTCVIAVTEKWRDDFDALVYKIDHHDWGGASSLTTRIIDVNADMIGEGFDRDHHIVNMCRGMPLAVACMISALAKERERQEQQRLWLCIETRDLQDRIEAQVERNGIQNTPGFEPLVESLELGYNHLPHHMLKTCLLYCSIYPEGHECERDDLVRRWIAEGFVCKEEAAEDYFDELVSRRLIIDDSLHPMMRNYLRQKLREGNFIVSCTSDGVVPSLVGRLCIDYWPSSDAVEDHLSGINWHHIRSLVIFKDAVRVPYKHLQRLRVLDVRSNKFLENQHLKDMCGLFRLRHLFVSGRLHGDQTMITEIPIEIARLQHLETLVVRHTGMKRLPAEIGDLEQLKTLDVSHNFGLRELPREMENLQHILERLRICGSSIRGQAWEIIWTLKKLRTLDVSGNDDLSGIPRDIGKLQQLETLDVSHNKRITELPSEIGNLQRLQALYLAGTGITKLPRDIGKLQQLETLDLSTTNVTKIPREIEGLKKLKELDAAIGALPFGAVQLSKLEKLPECVHKAWKNSDLVSSLAGEILTFGKKSLVLVGDAGLVIGTKHMHIPEWIKEHFNNVGSLDIRICRLEEPDLKILREMPILVCLTLRFEAVSRKPIVIGGGGFARLWQLTVDSRVPRVIFQQGAMPMLNSLVFRFRFYGGPPNTEPPMGIKHLVGLKTVSFRCNEWCKQTARASAPPSTS